MRGLLIPVILAGCTAHRSTLTAGDGAATGAAAQTSAAVAPTFAATQFVPAHPTYVLGGQSVQGSLLALAAAFDAGAVLAGADHTDAGRRIAGILHVNPFELGALAAAGIDLHGGLAIFSDAIDPTLVVHLSDADATLAFFDRLRDGGLDTSSIVLDKVEVYSTPIPGVGQLSWVVAEDYLWLHLALDIGDKKTAPTGDAATAWFATHGSPAPKPTWGAAWEIADANLAHLPPSKSPTPARLTGFFDLRAVLAAVGRRLPDTGKCAAVAAPLASAGGIAISLAYEDKRASGRFAVGLAPGAAQALAAAVVPAPEGWATASHQAAIGGQWNLDLARVAAYLEPCASLLPHALADAHALGIRTVRGFVDTLDLDRKAGTGAASLDVSSSAALAEKLDSNIPMRTHFESDKQFGSLAGHEIAIPFLPAIDYVLTEQLAMVATGGDLLTAIVGSGKPAAQTPLAAFDITPSKISVETWKAVFEWMSLPSPARVIGHMMQWQEGHLSLAVDRDQLVFEARGSRR